MQDSNTVARRVREELARALHVLHRGDDVPDAALDTTLSLAKAIACLTPSGGEDLDLALGPAREVLDRLRAHASTPAVRDAILIVERSVEALAASEDAVPLVAAAVDPKVASKRTTLQTPIDAAFAGADVPVSAGSGPTKTMTDTALVEVALDGTSASNFYHGVAGEDVAQHGGLFVASDVTLSIGSPIRMLVTVSGANPFEILGVVRWTRVKAPNAPAGFGASFLEVSPRAQEEITKFVATRPPFLYGA